MDIMLNFIFFREKIKEYTGIKRLWFTLLGAIVIAAVLLPIEFGLISGLISFGVPLDHFIQGKLLYLCIINIIIAYIIFTNYFYYSMHSMISIGFKRVDIDLLKFIKRGNKQIDLLGLSLKPFAREDILKTFEEKIEKDITIRILLLNPFTITSHIRPDQLYSGQATLSSEIIDSLINFINFANKVKANNLGKYPKFEVRLYSHWPTISMFRVDNHINYSVYLQSCTGLQSPYFKCDMNKSKESIFEKLTTNFEILWSSGISINENNWLNIIKQKANEQKEFQPNSFLSQQIKLLDETIK